MRDTRIKTYLLRKELYITEQEVHKLNSRLNAYLQEKVLGRKAADLCVYVRHLELRLCLVILHVDDLMLFARAQECIGAIKRKLKSDYSIKELGMLEYCLKV